MRNRYIDTLRAAAIVRVIVYHSFGTRNVVFRDAGELGARRYDT